MARINESWRCENDMRAAANDGHRRGNIAKRGANDIDGRTTSGDDMAATSSLRHEVAYRLSSRYPRIQRQQQTEERATTR